MAKRKRTPKSILKLPDLEQSKSAALNSLPSVSSQRSYDHAIRQFIDWYCSEPRLAFNRIVVTRYRIFLEQAHYASSTINLRLAAVRRLAYEAADSGLLSPDLAAGIRRVKGAKKHGTRVGNWLTADQGRALLSSFDRAAPRANELCWSSSAKFRARPNPWPMLVILFPPEPPSRSFPIRTAHSWQGRAHFARRSGPLPASTVLVSGKNQTPAQARNKNRSCW